MVKRVVLATVLIVSSFPAYAMTQAQMADAKHRIDLASDRTLAKCNGLFPGNKQLRDQCFMATMDYWKTNFLYPLYR